MASLKELQHAKGCTLLVTIHQPSPGVYRLFDGLVLLHRGALCYFGPGGDAPCTFLEQQVRQLRRSCGFQRPCASPLVCSS